MRFYHWDEVRTEVLNPSISRKVITGEKAMVAQVFIAKGGVVPEHSHESEQITYILEGALQFELEGRTVVVHKGEVLHIPSHVPHRAVKIPWISTFLARSGPTGWMVRIIICDARELWHTVAKSRTNAAIYPRPGC